MFGRSPFRAQPPREDLRNKSPSSILSRATSFPLGERKGRSTSSSFSCHSSVAAQSRGSRCDSRICLPGLGLCCILAYWSIRQIRRISLIRAHAAASCPVCGPFLALWKLTAPFSSIHQSRCYSISSRGAFPYLPAPYQQSFFYRVTFPLQAGVCVSCI